MSVSHELPETTTLAFGEVTASSLSASSAPSSPSSLGALAPISPSTVMKDPSSSSVTPSPKATASASIEHLILLPGSAVTRTSPSTPRISTFLQSLLRLTLQALPPATLKLPETPSTLTAPPPAFTRRDRQPAFPRATSPPSLSTEASSAYRDLRDAPLAAETLTSKPTTFLASTRPRVARRLRSDPDTLSATTSPRSLSIDTTLPLTDRTLAASLALRSRPASATPSTEAPPPGARSLSEQYRSGILALSCWGDPGEDAGGKRHRTRGPSFPLASPAWRPIETLGSGAVPGASSRESSTASWSPFPTLTSPDGAPRTSTRVLGGTGATRVLQGGRPAAEATPRANCPQRSSIAVVARIIVVIDRLIDRRPLPFPQRKRGG
mmetsp:Transcript_12488/g.34784  ORF Transcript_12488/g.34784 Transcript_12488/m.34784 type:complete len:381 (+) Transcript_12488:471-1613(+)